jgi:hypothetical protein
MAISTLINGVEVSYSSIELAVSGHRLRRVKSINYKDSGEIPKIRGTSATPIGRTRGTADCEGDIEIYRAELDLLLPILSGGGVFGYQEIAQTIGVVWAEALGPTRMDTLLGVRFHSLDSSNSEGGDAATVKFGLSIMEILWNGPYTSLRRSLI